jgi:hypothetical protein
MPQLASIDAGGVPRMCALHDGQDRVKRESLFSYFNHSSKR